MTRDKNISGARFVGSAPWIACSNLQRTVAWYRETLGFIGPWNWMWGDPPDHAGVSRGRTRILFFEDAAKAGERAGVEIVVYVEGVESLFDEYRHKKAGIVRDLDTRPWGTFDFAVKDPDGVILVFTAAPDWTEAELR